MGNFEDIQIVDARENEGKFKKRESHAEIDCDHFGSINNNYDLAKIQPRQAGEVGYEENGFQVHLVRQTNVETPQEVWQGHQPKSTKNY